MEQETKPYDVLNNLVKLMYKYCADYSAQSLYLKLGNFGVFYYSTEGGLSG